MACSTSTFQALPTVHLCGTDIDTTTRPPQAPGAGYAYRLEGLDRISVAYFGDGAASEGDSLTALNFAAVYKVNGRREIT
jgi:TPP-dependent pyruvate/acetoin dehydrogenase alpha subunit